MQQKICYKFTRYLHFLKNLLIVLSVWAIKEAVTRLSFSCPCLAATDDWWTSKDARQLYGSLYIVTPALLFWIIGLFLHENTWRCITGWRVQEKFVYPGRSCQCFFYTVAVTSLAPLTWVFFMFLDGRYLECIEASTPEVCLLPGADNSESRKLYMISQISAATIACGFFLLYLFVSMLSACCGSMTYYQLKHAHHVQDLEEEAFYQASEEFHKSEMRRKWKTLFVAGTACDWDVVSELPPTDPIKRTKRTFYTPFQNWTGTIAPKETLRELNHPVDTNMVTIVVKSSDTRAALEVVDKSGYGKHRGRDLPVPPSAGVTYSTLDTQELMSSTGSPRNNGHPVYLGLSEKNTDKRSLTKYEDASFQANVQTSTPKVKKKKASRKKKNRVDSTEEVA